MAKSARASRVKKNNTALRKKVFGPVESARQERLNAKLMAVASRPKPERAEMEIEETGSTKETSTDDAKDETTMEVDEQALAKKPQRQNTPKNTRSSSRVHKTRHRRARNDIVFAPTGKAKAAKANKRSKR